MDPAVAALDIAKAGVILANMIESYLAGGAEHNMKTRWALFFLPQSSLNFYRVR
jgi:hypothetical protein